MSGNILYDEYKKCCKEALDNNNREWLIYLSQLLENKSLKERLPNELIDTLKEYKPLF